MRISNQENIAGLTQEIEVDVDEVMCHVFDEKACRRLLCLRPDQAAHDLVAIAVQRCQHFVPPRMIGARDAQVMPIERLINNADIAALRETVH